MIEADLAANLEQVRDEIAAAAHKSGRSAGDVELVAVSKTHDADAVRKLVDAGQTLFGESRVQEAKVKVPLLPSHLRWHFIGHLQKNKVRHALPIFELLHSIDSFELAEQVDRIAAEEGIFPRVLVEINVSGEGSKHGLKVTEMTKSLERILELPRLSVEGLMTIAPLGPEAEESRPHFRGLRELRDRLAQELGVKLPQLSMGMSNDFLVAIEEGATLVRVGTKLFGAR